MKTYKVTIAGPASTRTERIRAHTRQEATERAEMRLSKGEQIVNCREV